MITEKAGIMGDTQTVNTKTLEHYTLKKTGIQTDPSETAITEEDRFFGSVKAQVS